MKRRLTILGDQKFMMKDLFNLSDNDVDQVKKFMEEEYKDVSEVLKKLIVSDLSERQKILAGYIIGNTFGVKMVREMEYIASTDKGSHTSAM